MGPENDADRKTPEDKMGEEEPEMREIGQELWERWEQWEWEENNEADDSLSERMVHRGIVCKTQDEDEAIMNMIR